MPLRVISLTGPSTSGKSTVLRVFEGLSSEFFVPTVIRKYSTRSRRTDDGREIRCVSAIPGSCDLVYEQYGVRYGLKRSDIINAVARGQNPIVIVNDIRVVEDLKSFFGAGALALYLFRESPSLDRLLLAARERGGVSEEEYRRRFQKAQAIHRVYIENISVFDHVILSVADLGFLRRQVEAIVAHSSEERRVLRGDEM